MFKIIIGTLVTLATLTIVVMSVINRNNFSSMILESRVETHIQQPIVEKKSDIIEPDSLVLTVTDSLINEVIL